MRTQSLYYALILMFAGMGWILPAKAEAGKVVIRIGESRHQRHRHDGYGRRHKRHRRQSRHQRRRDHHSKYNKSYRHQDYHAHQGHHHVKRLPFNYRSKRVNGKIYYYSNGEFYRKCRGEYDRVTAPIGAVVSWRPEGYKTVRSHGERYYYAKGAYYRKARSGYEVTYLPKSDCDY